MAPPSDLITSASMGPAPMTLMKLNGKNYVYWSRSVEVYLRGKGLFSHLESGQTPDNSSKSLWDQADNQIISLMLNSIEPHIGSSCVLSFYCKRNLGSSPAYVLWYREHHSDL